jgi:hypothetical protein
VSSAAGFSRRGASGSPGTRGSAWRPASRTLLGRRPGSRTRRLGIRSGRTRPRGRKP